jgi:hypothetical protein
MQPDVVIGKVDVINKLVFAVVTYPVSQALQYVTLTQVLQ